MLGPGSAGGTVQSVTTAGRPLEFCSYDGHTYTNPNGASQTLSREILSARGAIVIIPRQPLTPGATYTVSVSTSGGNITWSFTIAGG